MKGIKVNADYESVLFKNKPMPQINEALEFLALFLDERPLFTHKKYSPEFLEHVESITGRKPKFIQEGNIENWWGPLKDPELERKLNSKVTSSEFLNEGIVIYSLSDLPDLKGKRYLAKNPFGMSGQNFSMVEEGRLQNLEVMLKQGSVILEPFFNRVYDFSHYIFPNGVNICYQNLVDQKFQYKGSVFRDYTNPNSKKLKFFSEIDVSEWNHFDTILKSIISHYSTSTLQSGFSIDSFVYEENNQLKIRALSEVNYRRTMGQVAFELSVKFGGVRRFSSFLLAKSSGKNFSELKEKLAPIAWRHDLSRGVILLSPGDVRYDMFFLSALTEEEGKRLVSELKEIVPEINESAF